EDNGFLLASSGSNGPPKFMSARTPVIREANFVTLQLACKKLLKRFRFLSGLAMTFTSLLLPVLAAAQVTFVQVNSNSATVYTNKVAVPFTAAQAVGNL